MTRIPNDIIPTDPMRNSVPLAGVEQFQALLKRVSDCTDADNALDIEVEISLFEPDKNYVSVRPNAAGTKLIYTRLDGNEQTCWAFDWTLSSTTLAHTVSMISARIATKVMETYHA